MRPFLFSCAALLALTACSTDSTLDASHPRAVVSMMAHEPPETGEPAMHAIHNTQLQQVMHQINDLVYAQLNGELNLSSQRQLKAVEVARIAGELADSEKDILDTMPSLNLKTAEVSTFVALAEKLRLSALQMQPSAKQEQWQAISGHIETITNTCTSCHVLFRKSRSLLEKCKDPRYTC